MRRASDRDAAKSQAKIAVSDKLILAFASLICILSFLPGCSTADKPLAEAPPTAPATPAAADAAIAGATNQPQPVANNLPPPALNTVAEAVKRVFKDAALIDTTRQPTFVAGDFNGDLSQDIAVVIKPAPDKISEMNEEFPNWILRDPLGSAESRSPRLRIGVNDQMLAVIHGYGPNGWRDPEATQTFLLKNVAGSGMQTHPVREFAAANEGKKLPQLRGDLVGEVVEGKTGYLYFSERNLFLVRPEDFQGRGHRARNGPRRPETREAITCNANC